MSKCIKCGSYAFNLYKEGIDQGGLCDVHYWQGRAHRAEALAEQPAPLHPIGYEKYAAIRESHRNAREEAYFGARPDLPIATSTLTAFRHGFDRGYDLAVATPQRKPLTDDKRGHLVIEHLGPNALLHKPMSVFDAFHMGIDAAEAAHGIKEKNT